MKKRFLLLALLVGLMLFTVGVASASAADVTWNPDDKGTNVTLSNGNLTATVNSTSGIRATVGKTSGRWYWEVLVMSDSAGSLGVSDQNDDINGYLAANARDMSWYHDRIYSQSGIVEYIVSKNVNDICGIALDLDNSTIAFYKNGVKVSTDIQYNSAGNTIYPKLNTLANGGIFSGTVNFGATPFAYTVPAGYLAYNETATSSKTLEITAVDTANVGDAITADVVINGATNIFAEDIKVTYDTNLLTYVNYTEITGLKVFSATEPTPGTLRFIVASQGEANVVNGTKTLLTLNFTAKAAGDALVDITAGRIADTTQETDVTADQCGEKTITIGASLDVNRSGEFTLLDLAIDAWYHGKTVAETDITLYDADVIVDSNIDDLDLTEIVNKMLQNTNYAPNNS